MCRTCGCDEPDQHHHHHRRISLETDLLAKNERIAEAVRARFEHEGIVALNLIGTPGAGKTTLLEHTIRALAPTPMAVIEGDQATDHDARRIGATGCTVTQVNTGTGCHLDASMIERGLGVIKPRRGSLLFIENVGNLVCPALFDLGERAKVVAMSITEGEDKPLKYPHIFRAASVLVLTKVDLAPYVDVDPARCIEYARRINPELRVFPVAAPKGHGMAEWVGWLRSELEATP
jgi:hydrogenase nickel incorporation protein HypB